jgi:zinc transporter ZupT
LAGENPITGHDRGRIFLEFIRLDRKPLLLRQGIAVGAGYMHLPAFGLFIALAIGLHNIPEGIATALPLVEGGLGKWKAFGIALLSGLVEPISALAAALFLTAFANLVPAALAFAAGVMVFITLDELVPAAAPRTAQDHARTHPVCQVYYELGPNLVSFLTI